MVTLAALLAYEGGQLYLHMRVVLGPLSLVKKKKKLINMFWDHPDLKILCIYTLKNILFTKLTHFDHLIKTLNSFT